MGCTWSGAGRKRHLCHFGSDTLLPRGDIPCALALAGSWGHSPESSVLLLLSPMPGWAPREPPLPGRGQLRGPEAASAVGSAGTGGGWRKGSGCLGGIAAWSYLGQRGHRGGRETGVRVPALPCIYPGQPQHSPAPTWAAPGRTGQGMGCPGYEPEPLLAGLGSLTPSPCPPSPAAVQPSSILPCPHLQQLHLPHPPLPVFPMQQTTQPKEPPTPLGC